MTFTDTFQTTSYLGTPTGDSPVNQLNVHSNNMSRCGLVNGATNQS